ncbi:MAG: DUF2189 domain-containing protein [Hyphomicrobiaceae bacterium]
MAQPDLILPVEAVHELPEVRTITVADLRRALELGIDDFRAMPTHAIFLVLIYPIAGLLMAAATFGYDFVPLLYPLASGFALLGPFAAIGLYELSRRRESGLDTSWSHAFDIVHSASFRTIVILGLLLFGLFAIWIVLANGMYLAYFGNRDTVTIGQFIHDLLFTREGRTLAIVGNVIGLLFAIVAFTLTVVSFPLLLDRNVGFAAAIVTSTRAVLKNPLVMAMWGLIVAAGLAIGSLPLLVGLAIVLPILGHSTWHLYRMVVVPDPRSRPVFRSPVKGRRYAAEFPASLFARHRPDE